VCVYAYYAKPVASSSYVIGLIYICNVCRCDWLTGRLAGHKDKKSMRVERQIFVFAFCAKFLPKQFFGFRKNCL